MIKVAHRGNIAGRSPHLENNPPYLNSAVEKGYYCEVDVWFCSGVFFLGHDDPTYQVDEEYLENEKFICHSKNIEALHMMLKNSNIHCFWHYRDYCTLTSKNWVWKYPEIYRDGNLLGICSDWL
jgi:hypothetical protein|tara:strand:- start:1445 stop:1816 length:372 start_codon:yes stop_codon:yes gene_type:complete